MLLLISACCQLFSISTAAGRLNKPVTMLRLCPVYSHEALRTGVAVTGMAAREDELLSRCIPDACERKVHSVLLQIQAHATLSTAALIRPARQGDAGGSEFRGLNQQRRIRLRKPAELGHDERVCPSQQKSRETGEPRGILLVPISCCAPPSVALWSLTLRKRKYQFTLNIQNGLVRWANGCT